MITATLKALRDRQERRRAIRYLSELDDRMLRDLGISRYEIPAVVYNPDAYRNTKP